MDIYIYIRKVCVPSTRVPFPTPSELWGDYNVEGWTRQENGLLAVNLQIMASAIIYTNIEITNRIHSIAKDTIQKSKAGEMTLSEALEKTNPKNVFSIHEWNEIKKTAEKQGKMMAAFFMNDNSVN